MVLGVTLSGSRTGLVGIAVLALWGVLDGRLSRFSRGLLLAAPLLCAASWGLAAWWASLHSAHAIGAAARIGEGDLSASRFAIWRDTLALIRAHPWLGVGFGEFNFAWSLTPFPQRPVAFFDHTHNLPLQLAVELGVPLALAVLALLALALWQAWRRSLAVAGETGAALRAAFVMVLLMALHSQLEYPLWYAHFLLPTALVWGLCLGAARSGARFASRCRDGRAGRWRPASPWSSRPLVVRGRLPPRGGDLLAAGRGRAARRAHRRRPAQLVLRPPRRLRGRHHRRAPGRCDAGLRPRVAPPARHAADDRLGRGAGPEWRRRPRAPPGRAPARVPQPGCRRILRALRRCHAAAAPVPVRAAIAGATTGATSGSGRARRRADPLPRLAAALLEQAHAAR